MSLGRVKTLNLYIKKPLPTRSDSVWIFFSGTNVVFAVDANDTMGRAKSLILIGGMPGGGISRQRAKPTYLSASPQDAPRHLSASLKDADEPARLSVGYQQGRATPLDAVQKPTQL